MSDGTEDRAFILIVASDEGQTGLHTYKNADGTANVDAAIQATVKRLEPKSNRFICV